MLQAHLCFPSLFACQVNHASCVSHIIATPIMSIIAWALSLFLSPSRSLSVSHRHHHCLSLVRTYQSYTALQVSSPQPLMFKPGLLDWKSKRPGLNMRG